MDIRTTTSDTARSGESRRTGFVVIYQWRLKPGMDQQFLKAWAALTQDLQASRGARGSRLHRTSHGTYVAYAQWPDETTWTQACAFHLQDAEHSQHLLDAVEETWSPMMLTTVDDHLVPEGTPVKVPETSTH